MSAELTLLDAKIWRDNLAAAKAMETLAAALVATAEEYHAIIANLNLLNKTREILAKAKETVAAIEEAIEELQELMPNE
jgi:hypothetical protein